MEESVQQEPQPEPLQELQLEPFQEDLQEQPELENKNQNDQGDFRRRLRDRDLLKKRKAEAEEKETDEWDLGMESPKKRGRSAAKRGRRRGRPRKTDPTVITDSQSESALDQDIPAALTVLGQSPISVEAQVSDATVAAPVFEELNPAVQASATALEIAVDIPSIPVQYGASTAASAPLPMPPVTLEPTYTEPQSNPALDQCILIEDLGPDEEEDIGPSQDQKAVEDCSGKPIICAEEPTFFSNPTLSSPPPPPPQQEYVPRN